MLKNKRGITLISLVATIVVLLILAGVAISTLTGKNGIITQVQRAKNETEEARIEEKNRLSNYEDYINNATGEIPQVDDSNPGRLEGSGTEQHPFVINSIEDLVVFADSVTKGNTYEGQFVKLGQNLDFKSEKSYVDPNRENYYGYEGNLMKSLTSKEGFKCIGEIEEVENVENYSFNGIFNGNNKSIFNLYINKNIEDNTKYISIGMFSYNYGTIKNLTVFGDISLVVSNQDRKYRRNNR